jgi:hypothetical protein
MGSFFEKSSSRIDAEWGPWVSKGAAAPLWWRQRRLQVLRFTQHDNSIVQDDKLAALHTAAF